MMKTSDFEHLLIAGRQAQAAAGLLKSMANECRLLILCHLAVSGELSVGQLVDRVGLGQSALSQHLGKLREQQLVATRKEGQSVHYRLCDPKVERLLQLLHELYCPDVGAPNAPHSQGN